MPVYNTHDNGERAYRVKISNLNSTVKHVVVRGFTRRSRPLFQFDLTEIFVGKSPLIEMTRFSGGYGPQFDGNSLLIALTEPNTYLHIRRSLLVFRAKSPIVEYVSPVGNSDVPYPWAVDSSGNYYLMIEYVVLLSSPTLKIDASGEGTDPYTKAMMSPDRSFSPMRRPIDSLQVGNERYALRYRPRAGLEYDRIVARKQGGIILNYEDGTNEEIDREGYIEMM